MIIIIAIVALFLVLVLWIVFVPLVIDIDTDLARFQISQAGTIKLWLTSDFTPRLKILGVKVPVARGKKSYKEAAEPKPGKKRNVTWRQVKELLWHLQRSITVRRMWLNLDTDDFILNSQLVPAFLFLSRGPVQLSTNFHGRLYACFNAEVKIYRLGWALFLFFTKK